jgi:hypothetical protein
MGDFGLELRYPLERVDVAWDFWVAVPLTVGTLPLGVTLNHVT